MQHLPSRLVPVLLLWKPWILADLRCYIYNSSEKSHIMVLTKNIWPLEMVVPTALVKRALMNWFGKIWLPSLCQALLYMLEAAVHKIRNLCSTAYPFGCLIPNINTVSPLHTSLQVANFQNVNVHLHVQSLKFTCLAYIVTCVHPLQVAVLLCALLYSTV